MTEAERGLGQRWFELVWNQLRREAIVEMLPPDGVLHESGVDSIGPEGFYPFFDRMNATLSGLHVDVEDTIAEGDRLCVRWSCRAKHTGGGLGIDPTGVSIHVTGISIFRVAGNHIVEAWQNWDMLGMLEQIKGLAKSGTHVAAS
jgi:predicted ester cyclase